MNLHAQINCDGAIAVDNQGSSASSGSSIAVNYLDPHPDVGGDGGDVGFILPHPTTDPSRINISGTDGFNVDLTGGAIGSGSSTYDINTRINGSPTTGVASINYTITYFDGANTSGTPCMVTVSWAPLEAGCSFNPIITRLGRSENLRPSITNVLYDAGNSRYGTLLTPGNNLVDLSVREAVIGSEVAFRYDIDPITNTDIGQYEITGTGPDGVERSGTCTVALLLAPPVATAATEIMATSFEANWDAVSGATGYFIDVATDASFSNILPGFNNRSVTGTSLEISGLTAETDYVYRVRATNGFFTSGNSNIISVRSAEEPPAAPLPVLNAWAKVGLTLVILALGIFLLGTNVRRGH